MDLTKKRKLNRLKYVRFYFLLKRIDALPVELRIIILLQLNPEQLIELSRQITDQSQDLNLQRLASCCVDLNLWYDYLSQHGFLLPERINMDHLIQLLSSENQSPTALIRQLFFNYPSLDSFSLSVRQYKIGQKMFSIWAPNDRSISDLKPGQLKQAILDFDYLWRQIEVKISRRRNGSCFFKISIDDRQFQFNNWLCQHKSIGVTELFEMIERPEVVIKPMQQCLLSFWFSDRIGNPTIIRELVEQAAFLIADLLQENDLLELVVYNGEAWANFLYFFDGQTLIRSTESIHAGMYYLPKEALSYLQQKGINNSRQLCGFFDEQISHRLGGIVDDSKLVTKW